MNPMDLWKLFVSIYTFITDLYIKLIGLPEPWRTICILLHLTSMIVLYYAIQKYLQKRSEHSPIKPPPDDDSPRGRKKSETTAELNHTTTNKNGNIEDLKIKIKHTTWDPKDSLQLPGYAATAQPRTGPSDAAVLHFIAGRSPAIDTDERRPATISAVMELAGLFRNAICASATRSATPAMP